jgi:hypothetical protein
MKAVILNVQTVLKKSEVDLVESYEIRTEDPVSVSALGLSLPFSNNAPAITTQLILASHIPVCPHEDREAIFILTVSVH